jgi:predicted membrane channel-forming protein YqfA (hemolysin III family)
VHIEYLRHYSLSESIFVRFPSWSFRIFYEGSEERIDDVVKRVDYFYGIVLIIVGPYITIFEFSDEGEVDLVAVVRTVRRNYSRNKTATTKTK